MIALACVLLTAGLLYYVFALPPQVEHSPGKTRLGYLRERKDVVYENLRDLNFEYKAGKLSHADYHSLQAQLEDEAASILAEMDRLENQALVRGM
jgi:hypothetical protein